MEFEFLITATGDSTELDIQKKLNELGLEIVMIERIVECSDFLEEANISISDDTPMDFKSFLQSDVLCEKDKQELLKVLDENSSLSFHSLQNVLISISSDNNMTKDETEKLLKRFYNYIKATYCN